MKLQGTRTEKNLRRAFDGESQAAMKYFHFADEAEEDVLEEIFLETMRNEQEHAEIFAKYLGLIGETEDNLKSCISAESLEAKLDYPEMAYVAREEGFEEIATKFELIAKIEQRHRDRFDSILKKIESGTLYKRPQKALWECMECGYLHEGTEPPMTCPVCGHDTDDFMLKVDMI